MTQTDYYNVLIIRTEESGNILAAPAIKLTILPKEE